MMIEEKYEKYIDCYRNYTKNELIYK